MDSYWGIQSEDSSPHISYFAPYRGDMPKILLKDGKPTYLYVACGTNNEGGLGASNYVLKIHPEVKIISKLGGRL